MTNITVPRIAASRKITQKGLLYFSFNIELVFYYQKFLVTNFPIHMSNWKFYSYWVTYLDNYSKEFGIPCKQSQIQHMLNIGFI